MTPGPGEVATMTADRIGRGAAAPLTPDRDGADEAAAGAWLDSDRAACSDAGATAIAAAPDAA